MELNFEQKKIIQSKPSGNILVKGVAGSGKTTVAVHRIPFLLNHYCFEDDDQILMVTYNKLLVKYIQHIYEEIDEEIMYNQSIFSKNEKESLDIETVDSIMYQYFNDYIKNKNMNLKVIDNKNQYSILSEGISEVSKKYSNIKLIDHKYTRFLLDEIDWIKSCNYMEIEEYQHADRIGRTSSHSSDGPQRIMKNSPTRNAIYHLMEVYNQKLRQLGYIDFKDMALIAYHHAKNRTYKKYTHIIIDESQDLTKVQLEFLKLLYQEKEHASIMFICDTAQSIYPHSWLVKGRSFTSIGFDMTGKSNSLSKNYRTTTQIAQAAYSLIEKDDNIIENENYVKPSLIDKQGDYPVCRYFKNPIEESSFIINEIKGDRLKEYRKRDIAIIARKGNQLQFMKEKLAEANISSEIINRTAANFERDSIKLLTMHSIKGLEFSVVFIIGINADTIPYLSYQDLNDESLQESMDRKLLYVGMTRSNQMLYITTSGTPSKFIGDINNKYLKMDKLSRAKRYYNVGIENYHFKDKIIDIYSNEEKIRQWFIRELMETYKYPLNLIEVEYKVNNFSRTGSVDLCVCIYKNGNLIPYIFIETKAFGMDLDQAIRQVQSYMSCSQTCQYGVVVNGNEIQVINKDFEPVDDILVFNPLMLPSSIEYYKYIDIGSNKIRTITRDANDPYDIVVENENEKRNYNKDSLQDISIFTNVAAGEAIYMNEEIVDHFPLPKEWMKSDENYILRVKGDSMIEADISNEDYVVIQKQATAYNRDIVVAQIGEDVTLKRFIKMGDTILLIPENHKYEPIQLTEDQIRILGIAVGIIKKTDTMLTS